MIIPIDELEAETIENIIEAFVLREGTDYGEVDVSFEEKKRQVRGQLERGEVVLVYSELHESVNILPRDNSPSNGGDYSASN